MSKPLDEILAGIEARMRRTKAEGRRGLSVGGFIRAQMARSLAEVECRGLDELEAKLPAQLEEE